jgi:hypothetical protein
MNEDEEIQAKKVVALVIELLPHPWLSLSADYLSLLTSPPHPCVHSFR